MKEPAGQRGKPQLIRGLLLNLPPVNFKPPLSASSDGLDAHLDP